MYKVISARNTSDMAMLMNDLERNYVIASTEFSVATGPSGVPLYAVLVRYHERKRRDDVQDV